MRNSRQITVLRSLFRTLHPMLKSGIETGLAPARRMLTGSQQQVAAKTIQERATQEQATQDPGIQNDTSSAAASIRAPARAASRDDAAHRPAPTPARLPPLPRTLTDEHLVAELDNVTRQYELAGKGATTSQRGKPQRGNRHISRDRLLSLLEEAKVRIQVLETELELARGTEDHIPLLTEEWGEDLQSTLSGEPD